MVSSIGQTQVSLLINNLGLPACLVESVKGGKKARHHGISLGHFPSYVYSHSFFSSYLFTLPAPHFL